MRHSFDGVSIVVISKITAAFATTVGAFVLLGWIRSSGEPLVVLPGVLRMAPVTALGLLFCGLSLGLMHGAAKSGVAWRTSAGSFALLTGLVGLAVVRESAAGWDWRLNERIAAWGRSPGTAGAVPVPGSSLLDGVCLLCLGTLLVMRSAKPRSGGWGQDLLALVPIFIALLALLGYACGVPSFYGSMSGNPTAAMSAHAAMALAGLGIGGLCARGDAGSLAALLTSSTGGGMVARRLLLAPVLIPLATGLLTGLSRRLGFFNPEIAGWLLSFSNIFAFTMALWWIAALLDRAEKTRCAAEQEVRTLNAELESRVLTRTSELQHAKESLRRSEAFLARSQKLAHLGSWELDVQGGPHVRPATLRWSDETYRILGFSPGEVVPTSELFMSRVHPEDRARVRETLTRAIEEGTLYSCEHRICPGDGTIRTVVELGEIGVHDGRTGVMKVLGTIQDTTENKRAEQALAEERMLHRRLIEKSGDSITVVDADNRYRYLSPAMERVEGYTPEECVGQSALERVHADDLEAMKECFRLVLASPGKSVPVQWRVRHKMGHWIWLEGLATNLLADGAVGGVVTNYRDITERKQAELRLLAQMARLDLLHQITRGIAQRQDLVSIFQVVLRTLETDLPIDFGCVCLWDDSINELVVKCVGAGSAEGAMQHGLGEGSRIPIDGNGLSRCVRGELVFDPDLHAVPFEFAQRIARAGLGSLVAAPLAVEFRVLGVLIVARCATHGFSSGECEFLRQLSGHVSLAVNQAHLHEAMQQAYDDLQQTQQAMMQQERLRALGQMASGIAHDINNAISPLTLYTESLLEREPGLSLEGRGNLENIQRAVLDVAATVERLREFYRQPETQSKFIPVKLNRMVAQIVDLTRARWEDMPQQRGIVIRMVTELPEDLPNVLGVEAEIREALINLVFNAVDAMPTGGTMTLRTLAVPPASNADAGTVCLEIQDTGNGMDEETRRRCFEPFFTTKGERGTGLGLPMVYGVVQRHGAEIEIESTPNLGTCVRLKFPIPTAVPSPPPPPASTAVPPPPRPPLRILLVDDDPLVAKAVRMALQTDGHVVEIADGGQAGVNAFAASLEPAKPRFDLVITDLGMPYVDGRQVAAAVKQSIPSTPVILLTGWGQRLMDEEGAPTHVDMVLSKPTALRELRQALITCVPGQGPS